MIASVYQREGALRIGIVMGFKNPWVLLWVSLGYGYGLKNLYPGKTHTHHHGLMGFDMT
jgi:hypothetical protein